jgi:hypothetical protein
LDRIVLESYVTANQQKDEKEMRERCGVRNKPVAYYAISKKGTQLETVFFTPYFLKIIIC